MINADCDLNRLWQKNYGYVNLVPAFELKKDSPKLSARFRLAILKTDNPDFHLKSLTDTLQKMSEGTLVLPFVPLASKRCNFLLFPKEIVSVELAAPAAAGDDVTKIRNSCLTYESFGGFERICTISEPFLTPLVHTLLEALSGLGVPDYPAPVKNTLHDRSKATLEAIS